MRHYPGQGEVMQTTSNVKDREALMAWRQRSLDDQNRAIATLCAAFNQRMAALLTADAAKTAAAVIKKYTTAWDQSLVNTLGYPQEMQQTKRRLRVAAHEALRGELPIYDAVKALQQEYSRDYRAVVAEHPHSAAGDLLVYPWTWTNYLDKPHVLHFQPPFDVTELMPFPTDGPIENNLSATAPTIGWLLNDITWRDNNTFGELYDPNRLAGNDVALGINFQAPQTGFLHVAVSMRNLFNRITVSGTDNFGFSSATVMVYHWVFILVVRGSDRIMSFKSVVSNGWVTPGGDDFYSVFPDIPEGPVWFVADFEDALHSGEQVQILGGCQTIVRGDVSDMDCTATVKLLWQLQNMSVWLT